MRHFFFDTNVLIDFLIDRKPFSEQAAKLFNKKISGQLKIYVSAISYNNIYYLLRKSLSHNGSISILENLYEFTEIIDVTKTTINESLKVGFLDFEDAIQHQCAVSLPNIEFIITRNKKDFKQSKLPILLPEEALLELLNLNNT